MNKTNAEIVEEYEHMISGAVLPPSDWLKKVLEEKDKACDERVAAAAWAGWNTSGEGFNGEYTRRGVTKEYIWDAILTTLENNPTPQD